MSITLGTDEKKNMAECLLLFICDDYKMNQCRPTSASVPYTKIKPLQIMVDPLEVRGNIKVVHSMRVTNPDLNEELKDEVGEQIAFPFPRWNYREMIIDLMMIIYWLKCIQTTVS